MDTFITGSSTGLRWSGRAKWIPIATSAVALLLSFYGLVLAAIAPDEQLPNMWVWVFSIVALAGCPAIAIGYEAWLRFIERLIIKEWSNDVAMMKLTASCFKIFVDPEYKLDDLEALTREARAKSVEFEMRLRLFQVRQSWVGAKFWVTHAWLKFRIRFWWPFVKLIKG